MAGSSSELDVSWPTVPGASGAVVQWKTGDEVYKTSERRHEAGPGTVGFIG